MRKQLNEQIVATRDAHFLPEYEIALVSEQSNVYEYRLDDAQYPIKEIYEVASLSGQRGTSATQQQIKWLSDDNRFVRYWAVMGLCSQDAEELNAYETEIIKAMHDDYPPVAVLATSLACQHYDNKEAEELMKTYCVSKNDQVAHLAINQLLYHDNQVPFKEAILAAYNDAERNYAVRGGAWVFMQKLGYGPKNYNYMRK